MAIRKNEIVLKGDGNGNGIRVVLMPVSGSPEDPVSPAEARRRAAVHKENTEWASHRRSAMRLADTA